MVPPDSMGTACPPSGRNSTYPSVQISGTSSIIAMIAIDQIVDVVSVRNGLVATVGTVLMG
jgi:hypothetical protein